MKNKSILFLTLLFTGLLGQQTALAYYNDTYISRNGHRHETRTGAVASNVVDDIFGDSRHHHYHHHYHYVN